jgi:hypothetical protein
VNFDPITGGGFSVPTPDRREINIRCPFCGEPHFERAPCKQWPEDRAKTSSTIECVQCGAKLNFFIVADENGRRRVVIEVTEYGLGSAELVDAGPVQRNAIPPYTIVENCVAYNNTSAHDIGPVSLNDQYSLRQVPGGASVRGCGPPLPDTSQHPDVGPGPAEPPPHSFNASDVGPMRRLDPADVFPGITKADFPQAVEGWYQITSVESEPARRLTTIERDEQEPNKFWLKTTAIGDTPDGLSPEHFARHFAEMGLPPTEVIGYVTEPVAEPEPEPTPRAETWRDRAARGELL